LLKAAFAFLPAMLAVIKF